MLLSKTATIKWNSKIKKHYVNKGYTFTKMGDPFVVNVSDLTDGSAAIVTLKCDYCGKEYPIRWEVYLRIHKRNQEVSNDACKDCCELKAADTIKSKYGDYSNFFYAHNDQRKQTNIERYGCENPFGNSEIQEKIVNTNLRTYGVRHNQQSAAVRQRTMATCKERYGVNHYVELFKGKYIGENSPNWKGGIATERNERATKEYVDWRKEVFGRDHYTCQVCGAHSGHGVNTILNAHHLFNWGDNPDKRYDVNNGITLCDSCHIKFHQIYGKSNNTPLQYYEFKNLLGKKVC